jgi:hypothetical protein
LVVEDCHRAKIANVSGFFRAFLQKTRFGNGFLFFFISIETSAAGGCFMQ